jgi:hypothetical protein
MYCQITWFRGIKVSLGEVGLIAQFGKKIFYILCHNNAFLFGSGLTRLSFNRVEEY